MPPHTASSVVSTNTKAGLVTEDDPLDHRMTVWHDTIAVIGDVDVVLRGLVITVNKVAPILETSEETRACDLISSVQCSPVLIQARTPQSWPSHTREVRLCSGP